MLLRLVFALLSVLWTASLDVRAAPLPAGGPAAERRTALVIGNAAYRSAPLTNPVNDARLVAAALESARFKVTRIENATHEQMLKAVADFGDEIEKGGVGVFYFAGHGVQLGGQNYLVPVDARIDREEQIRTRAVNAQEVLDRMASAGNPLNLVFLDACRNDPFPRRTRSAGLGLAKMDAALGMLISFATAPGSVADDGDGRNSPYSLHLAESMRLPGLRIEDVLKRVRTRVREQTGGRQITWDSSSIEGDFYFHRRAATASDPAAPSPAPSPAPRTAGAPAAPPPALPRETAAIDRPAAAADAAPWPALLPRAGDTWTYRFRSNWRNVGERTLVHRVEAATQDSVRESMTTQGSAEGADTRIFSNAPELSVRRGAGIAVHEFNPFLLAFGPLEAGRKWNDVAIPDSAGLQMGWSASARVKGRERVSVPAGEFDAQRIELDANRMAIGVTAIANEPARIEHVFWYAAAAKRIVKHQRSVFTGNSRLLDRDVVELVAYELR